MMINAHPKLAISNLAGKLKGKTSYFMRKYHHNHVKSFYGAIAFRVQVIALLAVVELLWI